MRYLAAIILALSLTACATPQEPVERIVRIPQPISPPAVLLRCQSAPKAPGGAYTQADVAEFILDLSEAGADCRGKLAAVRRYVDDAISE
jgi:hypothetical protein